MEKSVGGRPIFYAHGTSEARGVAVLFKREFKNMQIHDIIRDVNGRYIIMKIQMENNTTMVICNCYAPNEDTPQFFQEVFGHVDKLNGDDVVIGGDFNTILSSKDINGGRDNSHPQCTSYINKYMYNAGLVDIWRLRHPETFRFTYVKEKPYILMERIDYLLVSFHTQLYVLISDISPGFQTDHSIPSIYIQMENPLEPGNGRWMFNTAHLQCEEFV